MKADKQSVTRLLKTAGGQIDGLIRMVEDDRYCMDISNQILACQSILKKVNLEVLKAHLNHCVKESLKCGSADDKDIKINELMQVLNKLLS